MTDDLLRARLREIIDRRLGAGYLALEAELRALLADVAVEEMHRWVHIPDDRVRFAANIYRRLYVGEISDEG